MTLKICEFNLENLFVSMAYYDGQDLNTLSEDEWRELALAQHKFRQKPLAKLWRLAEAILDIDADVLMLTEVGGEESLENLNRFFLRDRYEPFFVEGNSSRGIDLAYLVRRGLSYRAEARSNREEIVDVQTLQGNYATRFSRDVAELRLYERDSRLAMILLLVHLKSKITKEQDIQGKDARTAEAFALVRIYNERRGAHPGVPIVVGGDFNSDLASLELEVVRRAALLDFHDVLGTLEPERATYIHFDYHGTAHPETIDYLLVSPELESKIVPSQSCTYRYKSFYDIADERPQALQQRYKMPSDHYPLVLTLALP